MLITLSKEAKQRGGGEDTENHIHGTSEITQLALTRKQHKRVVLIQLEPHTVDESCIQWSLLYDYTFTLNGTY